MWYMHYTLYYTYGASVSPDGISDQIAYICTCEIEKSASDGDRDIENIILLLSS